MSFRDNNYRDSLSKFRRILSYVAERLAICPTAIYALLAQVTDNAINA